MTDLSNDELKRLLSLSLAENTRQRLEHENVLLRAGIRQSRSLKTLDLALDDNDVEKVRRHIKQAVATMREATNVLMKKRNKKLAQRIQDDADAIDLIAERLKKDG